MRHDQSTASMLTVTQNLFDDLPESATCEHLVELLSRPGLTIERIVSTGQASPPDFWYDQPHGEWVLVLQGEARLAFEGDAAPRLLKSGDFINIAPHQRHRVEWTHPKVPTVWLTVNYAE
ncbi:MAG: cupin 2 protein [Betaproteobacteria bacterium]|jgi:cupin 2 domain-containing protein